MTMLPTRGLGGVGLPTAGLGASSGPTNLSAADLATLTESVLIALVGVDAATLSEATTAVQVAVSAVDDLTVTDTATVTATPVTPPVTPPVTDTPLGITFIGTAERQYRSSFAVRRYRHRTFVRSQRGDVLLQRRHRVAVQRADRAATVLEKLHPMRMSFGLRGGHAFVREFGVAKRESSFATMSNEMRAALLLGILETI